MSSSTARAALAPSNCRAVRSPAPPVTYQDAGTQIVPMNPARQTPAGPSLEHNNLGKAADAALGTVQGRTLGENQASLPEGRGLGDGDAYGYRRHPWRSRSKDFDRLECLEQKIPGSDHTRFGARVAQLEGQAFLQAFESLKGAGQISEIEGEKAD